MAQQQSHRTSSETSLRKSPVVYANFLIDGKLDRDGITRALRNFLDTVVPAAKLEVAYRVQPQDAAAVADDFESPEIVVEFEGPDSTILLERGAELLKALEHVAIRAIRLDPHLRDRIRFDCQNYRAVRLAELKLSAEVAAERVLENRAPFRFNPMSPRERRIVHLVLSTKPGIRTASEGLGEERQLVVFYAGPA
jgi:spoIIIJ-associated protein